MIQSNNAAHAKAYFSQNLEKADYYINDQELKGNLRGKLAERLGLEGIITKEVFFDLCENRNPATGEALTPRTKEERRVGYDINYHAPKSVSIIHALSQDDHILKAFEAAVHETMLDIQSDAKVRVRADGQYDDRASGELIWAEFIHQTARPVENHRPDPHIHAHAYMFNSAWDPEENKIKAGQFGDIKRDMPYYQARFHKRLSDKLIDLGYGIRRTEQSFEIENVPERVIQLFSKRTDEIGRVAKEKGITDAKELSELGARTRGKKQSGLAMDELKADWKRQIRELGPEENGKAERPVRFAPEKLRELLHAKHCVDHAMGHHFERASVIRDRRLLETAYRQSIGERSVSLDQVTDFAQSDARLITVEERGQVMMTTQAVLSEEKYMVDLAKKGQGKLTPLFEKCPSLKLEGQQAEAVRHVLTTTNRVSIIRGTAGSGKTTLMKEATKQIEAAGKSVTIVAPTSEASRGVLATEGFENANTVARLLVDKKMQEQIKGQVLWVDEAGLLGTKDMISLLELSQKQDARLILGGDTRQHSAVVRGDALRILNTVGGIRSAEVNRIYRQRNETYRMAVEALSRGDVRSGFDRLDAMWAIRTIEPEALSQALATDYVERIKEGKSALVISPTHKQGEEVSGQIREKLRASGMLGKREVMASKLVSLNLTEAQKADWRNIDKGHVVRFNQNRAGIARGSKWEVQESNDNHIIIRDDKGETVSLPTKDSDSYDVYFKKEIALAKGDKVRITRNGFDLEKKRLNNGQMLEVKSVRKDGRVLLFNQQSKNTYHLDKDFGHLDHAYCITSHASQGKTVDDVLIAQPAATFPATNAKQLYVSVSRGRDNVRIYTEDKDALLSHASRMGDRQSAIELVSQTRGAQQQAVQQEIVRQQSKEAISRQKSKTRETLKPRVKSKHHEREI
ncbi:MAG: conjugal transfer protein [Cytophagaceae bacterium SCN 52-12]|nr:MAG: conjugal transfer protein [Cytophagaceae bacterium SCN 52-12]